MTRGRKPKPTPKPQPTPAGNADRLPDPPAALDTVEAAEWQRLLAALAAENIADQTDPVLLIAYCKAYGRWQRADQEVRQTGGEVVKSPNGFPVQNPWLSIANTAQKQMVQLAAEFGLSPTSRA